MHHIYLYNLVARITQSRVNNFTLLIKKKKFVFHTFASKLKIRQKLFSDKSNCSQLTEFQRRLVSDAALITVAYGDLQC